MARRTNKNENPLQNLSALNDEIQFENYKQKTYFKHYCTLIPNNEREELYIDEVYESSLNNHKGIVYLLVIDGKIFKIGQSILSFKDRLGSYNTGKMSYRSRGTNSGANFWVLQSLLKLKTRVEVYLYGIEHKSWQFLNEKGTEPFPSSKSVEKVFLKYYKEVYDRLPIGCAQT